MRQGRSDDAPAASGATPMRARQPPQVVMEVQVKGKRGNCSFGKLTGSNWFRYHPWQKARVVKAGRSDRAAIALGTTTASSW